MSDRQEEALAIERWQDWRRMRQAELSGPDSWLGMLGLFWLQPGHNRVGRAADAVVTLPSGPEHLGDLLWLEEQVFWQPAGGERRELQTDRVGQPTSVEHENLSFFIVDREGRLAARLRDRNWVATRPGLDLACFDFSPEWQIEADWVVLTLARQMEVPNVSGDLKTVEVSHQAVFAVAGERVSLLPVSVGEDEVFFVFRDRTSGQSSYGAGRFLKAAPIDGKIRLDFNRAYNPPCAFTPFATCPLPPPENWLPFAVPAGEKKP